MGNTIPFITEDLTMKVNQIPFQTKRGNMTIRGIAYRRADNVCTKLFPVVICHGFTSDQTRTAPYAEFLAEHGFAAYTFDFIGGGFNTISDGTMEEMTVLTEVEDLKCVIAYLKTQPAIDMKKLVLMGCSQGGFVSGLTAADLQEEIDRLVMIYPALCIPDDARKGSMQILKFDPDNVPEILEAGRLRLSGEYAKSVMNMDAIKEVTRYNGSVLIVHGDADEIVPYHYAEDAFRAYSEKDADQDVQLVRIPGAPHGFGGQDLEIACDAVLEFLQEE